MAGGIRINDAALEISPASLDAMLKKQGTSLTLTKINLSISVEALNTILKALAPQPASVAMSEGRMQIHTQGSGQKMAFDVQAGGLRLEITPDGLRLVSG